MDHNQLRDYNQNFSLDHCPLGNQGYNRVLLQLFGFTGHGKSALINSLMYVLNAGKYEVHAKSGVISSGGAVTMERIAYGLTATITVVDNRGLGRMNEFERGMIYAQLGNFMPLNEKVEWTDSYEDFVSQLEDSGLDPNYTDFIVPVFVYKVPAPLSEQEGSEIRAFFKNCRNLTGVFPIVVLTFKTSGDYFEVEKKFRCLGAEVVVAVENYSEEDQLQTLGRNTDFLNLLKSALDHVTFRMGNPRNPKEERIERKKFLLKYVHDIAMAESIEKEKMKQEDRKAEQDTRYQLRRQADQCASLALVAELSRMTLVMMEALADSEEEEEFMETRAARRVREAEEAKQAREAQMQDSKDKKGCCIQ
eukprot:XP_012826258.1 PREDICTED: uncharacterized protein LOC101733995 [Xenopus tropicalis]